MACFRKILVTTDFSDAAEHGLEEAERLARESDAKLVVLHVLEDRLPPTIAGKQEERIEADHRQKAHHSLEELMEGRASGLDIDVRVATGDEAEEIVLVAQDEGVDVIVMASHGRSALGRALLGSTTQKVLHESPLPVLVVPHRD